MGGRGRPLGACKSCCSALREGLLLILLLQCLRIYIDRIQLTDCWYAVHALPLLNNLVAHARLLAMAFFGLLDCYEQSIRTDEQCTHAVNLKVLMGLRYF